MNVNATDTRKKNLQRHKKNSTNNTEQQGAHTTNKDINITISQGKSHGNNSESIYKQQINRHFNL